MRESSAILMSDRYQGEKLLTLREAAGVFEYTSDHLAFLCRKGFLWAERHGRTWLTCKKAVTDYKLALLNAGKPVAVAEQSGFFQAPVFQPQKTLTPAESALSRKTGGPAKIQKKSRRFSTGWNAADELITKYRLLFARKHFRDSVQGPVHRSLARANLAIAQPPRALPIAPLPEALRVVPWYRDQLVTKPVFAVFACGLLVYSIISASSLPGIPAPQRAKLAALESRLQIQKLSKSPTSAIPQDRVYIVGNLMVEVHVSSIRPAVSGAFKKADVAQAKFLRPISKAMALAGNFHGQTRSVASDISSDAIRPSISPEATSLNAEGQALIIKNFFIQTGVEDWFRHLNPVDLAHFF